MMAKAHAPLSAGIYGLSMAGIAQAENLPHILEEATTPQAIGFGMLIAGAFALIPDIDTNGNNGTIGHKFGPIGGLLNKLITAVMGPHRWGMHSLIEGLPLAMLVLWLQLYFLGNIGFVILIVLSTYIAGKFVLGGVMKFAGVGSFGLGIILGIVSMYVTEDGAYWYAMIAAGVGFILHVLEDATTAEKVHALCFRIGEKTLVDIPLHLNIFGSTGNVVNRVVLPIVGSLLVILAGWFGVVAPVIASVQG